MIWFHSYFFSSSLKFLLLPKPIFSNYLCWSKTFLLPLFDWIDLPLDILNLPNGDLLLLTSDGGAIIDILRPLCWGGWGTHSKFYYELLHNKAWFIGSKAFKLFRGLRATSTELFGSTTDCTIIPPSCSILWKSFLTYGSFSCKSSRSPQFAKHG